MSQDEWGADPFEQAEKAPAMSFKDQAIGTVHTIDISEPARSVQQRDYDTDEPAFWPASPGQEPKPKMAAVFNGTDENGEKLSLWCPIPSDLFAKVGAAQKALGRRIGAGDVIDRIHVKITDRVPAKNPKFQKSVYAVKLEQLGAKPKPAEADPWASSSDSGSGFSDEPPF